MYVDVRGDAPLSAAPCTCESPVCSLPHAGEDVSRAPSLVEPYRIEVLEPDLDWSFAVAPVGRWDDASDAPDAALVSAGLRTF